MSCGDAGPPGPPVHLGDVGGQLRLGVGRMDVQRQFTSVRREACPCIQATLTFAEVRLQLVRWRVVLGPGDLSMHGVVRGPSGFQLECRFLLVSLPRQSPRVQCPGLGKFPIQGIAPRECRRQGFLGMLHEAPQRGNRRFQFEMHGRPSHVAFARCRQRGEGIGRPCECRILSLDVHGAHVDACHVFPGGRELVHMGLCGPS